MHIAMHMAIVLLHKVNVKTYLVMAALVGLSDAWSVVKNGECTMLPYFLAFIGVWVLENSTYV